MKNKDAELLLGGSRRDEAGMNPQKGNSCFSELLPGPKHPRRGTFCLSPVKSPGGGQ